MTETPPTAPRDPIALASAAATPWGRVLAIMGLCAGGFVWLVNNFEAARPVIEHPFGLFAWSAASFAAGAYLVHLLIVKPLADDLRVTRAKVDALQAAADAEDQKAREEERKLRDLISEKSVQIAALTVTVEQLQAALTRMEADRAKMEQRIAALEAELERRPRARPVKKNT